MTILSKKKQSSEKRDQDIPENHENRLAVANRSRTSPPPAHRRKTFDRQSNSVEHVGNFSSLSLKRRHKSPSSRNFRKQRLDTSTTLGASSTPSSPSTSECPLEEEYNSGDEYGEPKEPPEDIEKVEKQFEKTLSEKKGMTIKRMMEDGACLFRAVADQIYGDQEMHSVVRQHCMDYIAKNSDFFAQYITEDFNHYVARKRKDNCQGNHIEMIAMSELYNRPVEVYQYSTEPINTVHGMHKTDNEPIRISYHANVHYNSLVNPSKATIGVGLGLPSFHPGLADEQLMSSALKKSEQEALEEAMLKDKMTVTDWEATDEEIADQVARESYVQWLKETERREKRSRTRASSSMSTATASGSQQKNWWDNLSPNSAPHSPHSPSYSNAGRIKSHGQSSPVPSPAGSKDECEGAYGFSSGNLKETTSLMNELPPTLFGINDWVGDDDILAQVLAASQQDYLNSLKKNRQQTCATSSNSCSSNVSSTSASCNETTCSSSLTSSSS